MSYQEVLPSWAHQREARQRAELEEFFAFLMEMGTGKTKVVIDEIGWLYTEGWIDIAVIFAPKGVYMNWVMNELPAHMPQCLIEETQIAVWQAGGGNETNKARLRALCEPSPLLRVLVINTESVSSGDRAMRYLRALLKTGRSYVVVDESTFIKNPTAARSQNIHEIGRLARFRRIMSGQPVPRSPLDLWSQAEFLSPGLLGQSFYAFRARYAVLQDQRFGKRRVKIVVGYRNVSELSQRILPWSHRVTKEECLDLPPKVYARRVVELTPEQRRVYDEVREFAITELEEGGTVTAPAVITRLLRLQQVICGHVADDDGVVRDIETNRLDVLLEVLREAPGKVIVWSRFRRDIQRIVDAVSAEWGPGAVAQFHGGNTDTRHMEADRFIRDPECYFMIASYAGGHGNTWTVADTVVYYSNEFDLEKRVQSEDRAHRAGQTAERVTYVDLVAVGTVDEQVIRALREKKSLADTITGDTWREWI